MKRYKFRLQSLLDQRKSLEEQLLAELGELRREEAAEVMRLHVLCQRLEIACIEIEDALKRNAQCAELAQRDEYAKTLRDDVRVQELTIEAVRERVEAKRQEVVKAMQDRKVLETLRDKQEQEYLQAIARAEQNELDEMSSVRYARGL
ncbi:MAG: flagellar export protein FliJ [Armatimonadota bacterium]|nr:flagellar export protein FliJ [bacterium]